jgi:hypothetical protein
LVPFEIITDSGIKKGNPATDKPLRWFPTNFSNGLKIKGYWYMIGGGAGT